MLVLTTKRRLREREDEVFAEGANADADEVEDFIAGKDDFIAKQSWLIIELMKVVSLSDAWGAVPDDVAEELRNYA